MRIYEEVVRFHILSEHELCGEEASSERAQRRSSDAAVGPLPAHTLPPPPRTLAVTDMEGFDSHLNMEQMNKVRLVSVVRFAAASSHDPPACVPTPTPRPRRP